MLSRNSGAATEGSAPSTPAKAGDLRTRVFSALVLGPIVLGIVWLGGWAFHLMILAFALLTVAEWVRLVEPERPHAPGCMAGLGTVVVLGSLLAWGGGGALLAVVVLTPVLYVAARQACRARHPKLIAVALPYVAGGAAGLAWLREDAAAGLGVFLLVLLAVWATDTGAYAAGRLIGGPKLAPRVSPKKTWAGLLGGMLASGISAWAIARGFGAASPATAAALGAGIAVVSQMGDLFESWVKRRYGVKDSGHLIPGHGGLLDRVDGLLVAAPVFALLHAASRGPWW
ncbi:phosphatidate cytidylyltransferase [Arenibaculum pallidiluteum]|uniref:phosphatidate cytidylyltransferase n=1 Tax=Arenibaculum pallidiluteum TaxID=2812559 RepID=UPI001A9701B6|nr:phosphatidate cytidylyltransferase [Arenibaculum pallidiluteum]